MLKLKRLNISIPGSLVLSNPFTYTIVVSGSRKLFIIWKATKRGHPKQTALPSHTYSDSSVRKYFRHACLLQERKTVRAD